MTEDLSNSETNFVGGSDLGNFFLRLSHFESRSFKSLSKSATDLPSAIVLIIIPKLSGFMLFISLRSLFRSSTDLIFCDTETLSENGTRTR